MGMRTVILTAPVAGPANVDGEGINEFGNKSVRSELMHARCLRNNCSSDQDDRRQSLCASDSCCGDFMVIRTGVNPFVAGLGNRARPTKISTRTATGVGSNFPMGDCDGKGWSGGDPLPREREQRASYSGKPRTVACSPGRERFALSLRERAGVRGNKSLHRAG